MLLLKPFVEVVEAADAAALKYHGGFSCVG
jgi:hypothetical protein